MHILSPEADSCSSGISGRERMSIGNISWPISANDCCRIVHGLNPWPLEHQFGVHPTEPPRPALLVSECKYFSWYGIKYRYSSIGIYSRTSVAQIPMARLPRMSQTGSWVRRDFLQIRYKDNLGRCFFLYLANVCCVHSLELPQWGNSNEYTQHTFII